MPSLIDFFASSSPLSSSILHRFVDQASAPRFFISRIKKRNVHCLGLKFSANLATRFVLSSHNIRFVLKLLPKDIVVH